MFTMVSTRPNFAQAIVVSQFMVNPSKERNDDVKPILKYLWGTSNAAICYKLKVLQILILVETEVDKSLLQGILSFASGDIN